MYGMAWFPVKAFNLLTKHIHHRGKEADIVIILVVSSSADVFSLTFPNIHYISQQAISSSLQLTREAVNVRYNPLDKTRRLEVSPALQSPSGVTPWMMQGF